MKAIVDKSICIGCGSCVSVYPEGFDLDESGKSEYILPGDGDEQKIKESIDSCPVSAISEA